MKKFLAILTACLIFSGCGMITDTPDASPFMTLGTTEPSATSQPSSTAESQPTATAKAVFDIEAVKENDKLGDFTVKEVKRENDKVSYVRAEGKITLEGVFCLGDKLKDFDHTLYLKEGETAQSSDFAIFKFQRSANETLPTDEVIMNLDELMLVVRLNSGEFESDYGNAKIDISNINYTSEAKELKYYTFDAALHSQSAAEEHEFARQ